MSRQYVLDSSAVLAVIRNEPGAHRVDAVLSNAVISSLNLQEVFKRLLDDAVSPEIVKASVDELRLQVIDHDGDAAWHAARLSTATRQYGKGHGDRTCLSLAMTRKATALTADREWAKLHIEGLEIEVIR